MICPRSLFADTFWLLLGRFAWTSPGPDVPDGDLVIHAGDFTLFNGSTFDIWDFNAWLGWLPHKRKVLIPGNHDSGFVYPEYRELIKNASAGRLPASDRVFFLH